jgi:DNA polymerase III alpha subunit
MSTDYVELQVTSNFSFLRGASHPQELAVAAAALGHSAIAVTDRNSLAGVVRAHQAAKEAGIRLVVGARLDLENGFSLLAYPIDRAAYGRLCRLLTTGKRRAVKGECHLTLDDVIEWGEGLSSSRCRRRRSRLQASLLRHHPHPDPPPSRGRGWRKSHIPYGVITPVPFTFFTRTL